MNPTRISCKANEWKQILERNLANGLEVDLINLNCDYDENYCQDLAQNHGMNFGMTKESNYGSFKKTTDSAGTKKLPLDKPT